MLSREEVERFHREGYLALEGVLSDQDLAPIIEEIGNEVNARACRMKEAGKLSDTFTHLGFERQLAAISKETDEVALSIWNSQLHLPSFFALLMNPKILDVADQLLSQDPTKPEGEIVASAVYRLRPKIPNYGYGEVPWHQDSSYFEPYCDSKLILTIWVPLVESTIERGCLYVLPKAHHSPTLLEHMANKDYPYLEIHEEELIRAKREEEPVPVPIKKGGILVMTNRTPHASFKNETDIVRWGMDLRFQSSSLPTNADPSTRVEAERGESEVLIPTACYPPEPDFYVRSSKYPYRVLRRPQDFVELRKNHTPSPVTQRWGQAWQNHTLFNKTNAYQADQVVV